MGTNKKNEISVIAQRLQTFIQGAQSSIPQGTTLNVNGKNLSGPQLVAQFQTAVAPYTAITSLRAQLKPLMTQRNQGQASTLQLLSDASDAVISLFGHESPTLTQFGITEKKKAAPLTAEQLVARSAKSAATRSARGTKGSRQRQAITGTVPGNSSPVTAPATQGNPTTGVSPVSTGSQAQGTGAVATTKP
jgi:hypothetical protein